MGKRRLIKTESEMDKDRFICKKCKIITRATDYLAEDYCIYLKMKQMQLCEECLRCQIGG